MKFENRPRLAAELASDLSRLLEAGLPLDAALEVLEKEHQKSGFRKTIKSLRLAVLSGRPLSEALEKQRAFFPDFLTASVRAAEKTGQLPLILKESARHLEDLREFKSKIAAQLIYPALVVSTAAAVLFFLGFFVLPSFNAIFAQSQLRLPLVSRIILGGFNFFRKYFFWLAGTCLISLFFSAGYLRKNSARLILKFPPAAELIKKISLSHFCRTLALLLESGSGLLESVNLAAQTVDNKILRARLAPLPVYLSRGWGLKKSFERIKIIPERLCRLATIAEETGTLGSTMAAAGVYYQNEVEKNLQLIVRLAEPAVTLLIGLLVALILAAVFLPLVNLAGAFSL